jgi:hypothetical protein
MQQQPNCTILHRCFHLLSHMHVAKIVDYPCMLMLLSVPIHKQRQISLLPLVASSSLTNNINSKLKPNQEGVVVAVIVW